MKGDKNMKGSVIHDIFDISDCQKLDENVKYVTLDITTYNASVISYLINNGKNLLFTDRINKKRGFVYIDYNTFLKGQSVIDKILDNMPKSLTKLEIARYLYISLGKIVGYDINILEDKNDFFNLSSVSSSNSIWHTLSTGKASNISLAKTYMYLCSIFDIKCEIITTSEDGYLANKLYIDNKVLTVNLSKDLAFIQSSFPTTSFAVYNNDIELDKKIGYIKKTYNDKLIDKALSSINLMNENIVLEILMKTQKILDVSKIKPNELAIIYNYIFNKYCPNYDITINNLYINDNLKQHFILISYDNKHYSYNYKKQSFAVVDNDNLIRNLDSNKIGVYENELIPNIVFSKKSVAL